MKNIMIKMLFFSLFTWPILAQASDSLAIDGLFMDLLKIETGSVNKSASVTRYMCDLMPDDLASLKTPESLAQKILSENKIKQLEQARLAGVYLISQASILPLSTSQENQKFAKWRDLKLPRLFQALFLLARNSLKDIEKEPDKVTQQIKQVMERQQGLALILESLKSNMTACASKTPPSVGCVLKRFKELYEKQNAQSLTSWYQAWETWQANQFWKLLNQYSSSPNAKSWLDKALANKTPSIEQVAKSCAFPSKDSRCRIAPEWFIQLSKLAQQLASQSNPLKRIEELKEQLNQQFHQYRLLVNSLAATPLPLEPVAKINDIDLTNQSVLKTTLQNLIKWLKPFEKSLADETLKTRLTEVSSCRLALQPLQAVEENVENVDKLLVQLFEAFETHLLGNPVAIERVESAFQGFITDCGANIKTSLKQLFQDNSPKAFATRQVTLANLQKSLGNCQADTIHNNIRTMRNAFALETTLINQLDKRPIIIPLGTLIKQDSLEVAGLAKFTATGRVDDSELKVKLAHPELILEWQREPNSSKIKVRVATGLTASYTGEPFVIEPKVLQKGSHQVRDTIEAQLTKTFKQNQEFTGTSVEKLLRRLGVDAQSIAILDGLGTQIAINLQKKTMHFTGACPITATLTDTLPAFVGKASKGLAQTLPNKLADCFLKTTRLEQVAESLIKALTPFSLSVDKESLMEELRKRFQKTQLFCENKKHCQRRLQLSLAELLPAKMADGFSPSPFKTSLLDMTLKFDIEPGTLRSKVETQHNLDLLSLTRWQYRKLQKFIDARSTKRPVKPQLWLKGPIPLKLAKGESIQWPGGVVFEITHSPIGLPLNIQGQVTLPGQLAQKSFEAEIRVSSQGTRWHYNRNNVAKMISKIITEALGEQTLALDFAADDVQLDLNIGLHLSDRGLKQLERALTEWARSVAWKPLNKINHVIEIIKNNAFSYKWLLALGELHNPTFGLRAFLQDIDLGHLLPPWSFWHQGQLPDQWPGRNQSAQGLFHLSDNIQARVRCTAPNNKATVPYYQACELRLVLDKPNCAPRLTAVYSDKQVIYLPFVPLEERDNIFSKNSDLAIVDALKKGWVAQQITGCTAFANPFSVEQFSRLSFQGYIPERGQFAFDIDWKGLKMPFSFGIEGLHIQAPKWTELSELEKFQLLLANKLQLPEVFSPPANLLPNIERPLKWPGMSKPGSLKLGCQAKDTGFSCHLNMKLIDRCQVDWSASTEQVTSTLRQKGPCFKSLKTALSQQLGLHWPSLSDKLENQGVQIILGHFQFSADWQAISAQVKFDYTDVGGFTIPIEIGFNGHVAIKTNIGEFNHFLENLLTRLKLVDLETSNSIVQQCQAFKKAAEEKLTAAVKDFLGVAKFDFKLAPGCPDSLYDTDAYNLNNQNAIFGIRLDRAGWKLCIKGIRYNLGKETFDFSQASFCKKEENQVEALNKKLQKAMAGLSGGFMSRPKVTNYYFTNQALILNYQTQIDLGEVGKLLKMSPQTISGQFTLPFKKGGVFDASVNFDQVFEKGVRHLLFSKIEKALKKLGNQGLDLFQLRFELAFKQLQYDEKQQQFLINFKVFDENRLGLKTDRKKPLFKDQVRIDRHAQIHWNKQGFKNALVKAFAKKSGFSDILSNLVSIPSAGITVEKTEPLIDMNPFALKGIRFLASFEAPEMLAKLLEDANVFPVKVWFRLDSNGLHAENFKGISIPLAGCIPIPPVAVEPTAIHLSDNAVNLRGVVTAFECETKHLAQLKANIEIPFNAPKITTTGDLILLDYIPAGESTVTATFAPPKITLNVAIGGMLSDIISLQGKAYFDTQPLKLSGEVDAKLFGYDIAKAILNAGINPAELQVKVTMDLMLADFQGVFMMGGTPRLELEATVNLVIANPSVALNVRESYVGVGLEVWGSGISFTISSLDGLTADSLLALFKLNFGILTPENLLKAFEAILSGKFSINGFGSFSAKSGQISSSSGEGGDDSSSGKGGDEASNGVGDYTDLKSHLTQKTPESKPLPTPDEASESQYAAEAEIVSSLDPSESPFRLRLQPEGNAVRLCVTAHSAPCTDKNTFAWTNVKLGEQQHLNTKNGKANTKGYVMGYGDKLFAHIIRHDDPKTQCTDAALHWFVSTAPVTTENIDATKNLDSFVSGHLNLKQWHYPSSQSGFCYDQLQERLAGNSKMPRLRRRALNRMLFDIGQVLAVSSQIKKNESQRDQFFQIGEIIQGVVELEGSLISSIISNSKVSLIVQRAANPHLNDTADMLTIYTAGWREYDQMTNGTIVFPIYGASELLGNDSLHQHRDELQKIHDQLLKLYEQWWREIEPEWQKHKKNAEKADQCFVARPQFITRLTRVSDDLMLETPVGLYQGASFWYKYSVGLGAQFKQVKAFKPSLPSGGCLEHSIPQPLPEKPPVLPHPNPDDNDPSMICWDEPEECAGGGGGGCQFLFNNLKGQNVKVWQYIDQEPNKPGCQTAPNQTQSISKFVQQF